MLDYGSRSRCCKAPIRLNKIKRNNLYKQVWQCTKCRKSGIDIIPTSEINSQVENEDNRLFSEET